MKPRDITELYVNFHGGIIDNDLWILYPAKVEDTVEMLQQAKSFIGSPNAWAELTMKSIDGRKEIHKLYADQNKVAVTA